MLGDHVFFNPIFTRFFTASLHLLLFLIVFASWMYQKIRSNGRENRESNPRLLHRKPALFSSLCLSLFNLVLCPLNLFYWYSNGWSHEKILTLSDLGVKAAAWLALCLFLRTHFLISRETRYPLALLLWWGLFLSMSCYCLMADFLYFRKHRYLSSLFWASDIVSSVMGFILCYIGFSSKKNEDLKEPLLNDHSASNGGESNKPCKGDQTVTPYSKAGVFSLFTFSWMSPLISLGYNKTLDLEDIPQLDIHDTAGGAFPIFNSKLETFRDENNRVTTIMLVKGLVFTVGNMNIL